MRQRFGVEISFIAVCPGPFSLCGPIVVGLGHVALVDGPAFEQAVDIEPVNTSFPAGNLLSGMSGMNPDAIANRSSLHDRAFRGPAVLCRRRASRDPGR